MTTFEERKLSPNAYTPEAIAKRVEKRKAYGYVKDKADFRRRVSEGMGGKKSYSAWHRVSREVYEKFHGVKLNSKQVVHHLDNDQTNNDPENLHMFESASEHIKYHEMIRAAVRKELGIDTSQKALARKWYLRNRERILAKQKEARQCQTTTS